jgi:hypothetical protein
LIYSLIQSITNPNQKQTASMIVENYPLIPRSLEELENMRHIIERRRIEIAEKKLRRQILSDSSIGHETGSDMPSVNSQFPSFSIRIKSFLIA